MNTQETYRIVQDHYGALAKNSADTSFSTEHAEKVSRAFGYSIDEMVSVPEGANLGVGCGNPVAVAKPKEGETIVDLGSGAGFDVFLAAKAVGPSGSAIGVDMNKDMLELARRNATKTGAKNVSFVESPITSISLPAGSADCIISNCVVNLVPADEKHLVFKEIFRLLKPGGRVAISDILTKKDVPAEMLSDTALYVGCMSGAAKVEEYERYLKEAGFKEILIVDTHADLNVYEGGCGVEPAMSASGDSGKAAFATAFDSSDKKKSCCGPSVSPANGTACAPASESSDKRKSCCGPSVNSANGTVKPSSHGDLNEYFGSFKTYALKGTEAV